MKRARVAAVGAVVSVLCSSCFGTVGVVGEVDEGYPPPAFIATATPVYYEGHATYWYGGQWYARDGARWSAYRAEPVYLRDYRARGVPPRQLYGRGRPVVSRPAVAHPVGGHPHR